jgi:hypothetical protein
LLHINSTSPNISGNENTAENWKKNNSQLSKIIVKAVMEGFAYGVTGWFRK